MELPKLGIIDAYVTIPSAFHSFATGKPFERCVACEKYLLQNGTQYVVEKAIKKYPDFEAQDVIYEYAMCLACADTIRQALSVESLIVIDQYFESRVNLVERRKHLLQQSGLNIQGWLANCLITGTEQNDLTEYQLYALCDGEDLLFTYLPYMISAQALDELANLLSPQTKDQLENFIDTHFGAPPALKEIFKYRKSVLL